MADKEEQIELELDLEDKTKDELVVKVEDSEKDEPEVEKTDKEEVEDPAVALAALKKQLEDERQARFEAEKRARSEAERARQAYSDVEDTNLQLINSAISTVQRDIELMKDKYAESMSIGDYNKAAEYQAAMSSNAARLLQLENGKSALEAKVKEAPNRETERYSDPVEAFASQLSPRSADWVRKHPQFVTDQRLNQKMIAAHNLAMADGYEADSDDYFAAIEETLKIGRNRQPQRDESTDSPLSSASKPASRSSQSVPPPSAPVRDGGARSNVVRLSRAEAEIAKSFGMTEQEYAKHKLALKKEGKLMN